jgi:hypothetical protein
MYLIYLVRDQEALIYLNFIIETSRPDRLYQKSELFIKILVKKHVTGKH